MAAEKIVTLKLQRDYKSFLYYIDKDGSVCAKPKGKDAAPTKVLAPNAIKREPGFLYYLDKDGDISRSPMGRGKKQ